MTDKQVIDDVDVSGCLHYSDRNGYCEACKDDIDGYSFTKCSSEDNCYYKQLARKEQEYEELKAEIKHYKQIAQYHGNLSVKYTNKSAKYKQTLAEIKEIAENHKATAHCDYLTDMDKILQKISEVENERN